ncbi:MAG: hypothetical protein K8823_775 [Cenarchaeum symbiont of Oopsacas minuta]|nr:hypothetical protein [Cenarchaeum symbiont of Oopsacas minuta]
MSYNNINEKILKKLEKFSKNASELKMCKELLEHELSWTDIHNPPFKREFSHTLTKFFPLGENDHV